MSSKNLLKVTLLCLALIFSIASTTHSQETLSKAETHVIQDAEKILVKISGTNATPKLTKLSKPDSSVFFVNSTAQSLLTLSINFGKRKAHCSSGNMKWFQEEGILKSVEPIAPKDFVVLCFPESGTYDVSIFGLKNDETAEIIQVLVP